LESLQAKEKLQLEIEKKTQNYGVTKPVSKDLNAQTKSVHEALKTGKYPERLHVKMSIPFNLVEYNKDPQKYIDTIEPGRVYRPAQPSKDTPVLSRASESFAIIKHGESVELSVQLSNKKASQPVTFTSLDLGRFENQLTSINVITDNNGLATTKFYGAEGTIDDVSILAASPMASGRVAFIVKVTRKDGTVLGQLPKSVKE
jgi:hypothetical protein